MHARQLSNEKNAPFRAPEIRPQSAASEPRLLVEAGGGLVGRLAGEHLVNEVLTMIAPKLLGDTTSVAPFRGRKVERISDGLTLDPVDLRVRDSEFMGWYRTPDDVTER